MAVLSGKSTHRAAIPRLSQAGFAILCFLSVISHTTAQSCLYGVSPTQNPRVVHVGTIDSREQLYPVPLTLPDDLAEPTTWGMGTDPQGNVSIAESGSGFILSFNPKGDPDKWTQTAKTSWDALPSGDERTTVDSLDQRYHLIAEFDRSLRPMIMRWSPSGKRLVVLFTTNSEGLIGAVVRDPYQPTQQVTPIKEFEGIRTNGPYTGATWISESEFLLTVLSNRIILKVTVSPDPTPVISASVWMVARRNFYWTIWYDAPAQEVYLGCAEKGPCIDVVNMQGEIVRTFNDKMSGTVLDIKVNGSTVLISGRAIAVMAYDKLTFDVIANYSNILPDDITAFAYSACPVIDRDPNPPGSTFPVYIPVSIAAVLLALVVVVLLIFVGRMHRKVEAEKARVIAAKEYYKPEKQFFNELVKVRRDPLVPKHPSFDGSDGSLHQSYVDSEMSEQVLQFDMLQNKLRQQLGSSSGQARHNSEWSTLSRSGTQTPGVLSSLSRPSSELNSLEPKRPKPLINATLEASANSIPQSEELLYNQVTCIPPEDIEIQGYVGSGGFADVFLGVWKGINVAVKILRDGTTPHAAEQFKRELYLLTKLRHPNVTLMMGAMSGNRLAMVTEFLDGGSLFGVLEKQREEGSGLPLTAVYSIARDIACGMLYLHTRDPPLVHRDIKSLNIFLDSRGRAHVGDFGLSKEILGSSGSMTQVVGTPAWMAPELVQTVDNPEAYTTKVDVYAYAVVLYEMVTTAIPYEGQSTISTLRALIQNVDTRPDFPENTHPLWRSFIEKCWASEPDERPDFGEILELLKEHEAELSIYPDGESSQPLPALSPAVTNTAHTGPNTLASSALASEGGFNSVVRTVSGSQILGGLGGLPGGGPGQSPSPEAQQTSIETDTEPLVKAKTTTDHKAASTHNTLENTVEMTVSPVLPRIEPKPQPASLG